MFTCLKLSFHHCSVNPSTCPRIQRLWAECTDRTHLQSCRKKHQEWKTHQCIFILSFSCWSIFEEDTEPHIASSELFSSIWMYMNFIRRIKALRVVRRMRKAQQMYMSIYNLSNWYKQEESCSSYPFWKMIKLVSRVKTGARKLESFSSFKGEKENLRLSFFSFQYNIVSDFTKNYNNLGCGEPAKNNLRKKWERLLTVCSSLGWCVSGNNPVDHECVRILKLDFFFDEFYWHID